MIFTIDGSSFLKVIDKQNTLYIPKYGDQNVAWWCLNLCSLWVVFTCCCLFSRFDSGVKWWIRVSFFFTRLRKKSFLLRWNSCKQRSESLNFCYFWSTVSKRNTHIEHSFLIDKCSCKMMNTLPSDITCNFNLWLAQTSLWIFFSETTAKYEWLQRSASFVYLRHRLKSAYHLLTLFWTELSPNNTYQAIVILEQYLFRSESYALLTLKIQMFSLFWKFATNASLK